VSERSDVARWMAGRRAAAARERDELRGKAPAPREALARALSLIELAASRHGWPLPASADDEAEDLAFHEAWARLRRRAGIA
jgi:hypothetical protein